MNASLKQYQTSYSYSSLMSKHSMNEEGLWQIYGEDPNCDFNGPHHQPLLETVQGKLKDILEYAVTLPRFFTWGGGGEIKKVIPKVVNSQTTQKIADLKEAKAKLQKELNDIENQLKEF